MLDSFNLNLKDKWLDYYQVNRSWIKVLLEENNDFSSTTSDDAIRPRAWFILGVISGLEPNLKGLLPTLCKLNDDEDDLIEALGLDFDPEKELDKRSKTQSNSSNDPDAEYLNKIRQEHNS